MKKCISIILVITLIFSATYTCVYASESEEEDFFELSETEISQGKTLELIIDLNKIEYDYFVFELTSNYSLDNVEVSEENVEISAEEDEETSSEEENYTIKIQIDKTNLENIYTIVLYYTIPDSAEIGETITFIATITNLEDEEQTENVEKEVTIVEEVEENEENNEENNNDTDSITKDYANSEEQFSNQNASSESQNMSSQEENSQYMSSQNMNAQNSTSVSMSSEQVSDTTLTTTTQDAVEENSVTYNGSDNNYLNELYIEDIDLTQDFTKDNNTYFANVDSDVDDIEIVATAEDDGAVVCIYGNEDLQDGVNKVLISVTAENGNVRYYRIYVTKS